MKLELGREQRYGSCRQGPVDYPEEFENSKLEFDLSGHDEGVFVKVGG